jgi:DnaJ-class molecular chaperone
MSEKKCSYCNGSGMVYNPLSPFEKGFLSYTDPRQQKFLTCPKCDGRGKR